MNYNIKISADLLKGAEVRQITTWNGNLQECICIPIRPALNARTSQKRKEANRGTPIAGLLLSICFGTLRRCAQITSRLRTSESL